ncbi:cytochrome P450 2K6-like [Rana temporaria]|uniref:cytochrome P450 2K6-like n=1 Tax=Rana temporaria TaxID=8407 RepID=UPI001AADE7B1|nr:cytochrome P450 2K6-like [Rana temporaria]
MEFTLTYLFTIYGLLFLAILYIIKEWGWRTSDALSRKFPPGPRALPVIGNLHMINLGRPNETFMKLSKQYGSVFSIQMGGVKMVVLSGYETVKNALVDYADEFAERPHIPMFEDMNKGFGVPFSHGENWRIMRRFTLRKLRDFGMGKKTIEDRIVEECGFFTKELELLEGKPEDLASKTNFAIGNIIISIIFGHRFDYQHPILLRLIGLISENMRLVGSPSIAIYNFFPIFYYLCGAHSQVMQNIKDIHNFLKTEFVEHLQGLDRDDQRGFIDAFLVKQEEEKLDPDTYFHEMNLLSTVTTLFMAGTETTSATIRWALIYMIQYPEIQKKVHEEINRVIGSVQPRIDHRKDMPYTNAVIHETQRFANILPMNLPRETTRDVTFQGYHLPKGTYIVPLLESVLYDKTQFERPESFYPEHFLDSQGAFVKKEAFMPFSAGRRTCPGETLAKMELFLFFTSLMQKFTIRAAPGLINFHVKSSVGLTVTPLSPKICCVPRSY